MYTFVGGILLFFPAGSEVALELQTGVDPELVLGQIAFEEPRIGLVGRHAALGGDHEHMAETEEVVGELSE